MNLNKIAIGTAQFGMDYGFFSRRNIISKKELFKILSLASEKKIFFLDTAKKYGKSEEILGSFPLEKFNVTTKIDLPIDTIDIKSWVDSELNDSIAKMNIKALYGVYFHDPNTLLKKEGNEIYKRVKELKDKGLIKKIGVSIYSPSILDEIFDSKEIDLVQSPLNIFDERIITSGWARKLKNMNVELHIRSIFLQGILLEKKNKLPKYFNKWEDNFEKWNNFLCENGLSALNACLAHAMSFEEIDKIIIGIEKYKHIKEILESIEKTPLKTKINLSCEDKNLIDPRNWKFK